MPSIAKEVPSPDLAAPGRDAFAVTPSNTVNFDRPARSLYVGTTGNVTLVTRTGTVVTFVAVPAGGYVSVCCTRVNATATTASDIVGLV